MRFWRRNVPADTTPQADEAAAPEIEESAELRLPEPALADEPELRSRWSRPRPSRR